MSDFGALLSSPHTWLNDEAMDHAQALLKAQFPSTEGLYATTSVALLSTVPGPTQGFVQIFNLSANHWVTVSNIGCKVREVNVFDSMNASHTPEFLMQITALVCFPGRTVRILWPSIQQQHGGSDCGLFAIANSLTLCRGEDPCQTTYNQVLMRAHLFSCFQRGHLAQFPESAVSPPFTMPQTMEVEVHCHCRRPIRDGKDAVVCRRCGQLFHQFCVGTVDTSQYVCKKCTVIVFC